MTHGVVSLVLGSIIKVRHDNINNYDKDQVALALKTQSHKCEKMQRNNFQYSQMNSNFRIWEFQIFRSMFGEPNLIQIGVF
jgi:hypothetical protein